MYVSAMPSDIYVILSFTHVSRMHVLSQKFQQVKTK